MLVLPCALVKVSGVDFWSVVDKRRYALLSVWEDHAQAQEFWQSSEFAARHGERAWHRETFWLETLHSAGKWAGENPFPESERKTSEHPVGIITRATIRASRLREFWHAVPKAAKAVENAQGMTWFKGIGELPWVQQATFSVWESQEAGRNFAYKSQPHADIVKKTRARNWYSEDLFARFAVVDH
ncbi:MAG: heme-degrading monooxygenase HmoA [Kiritimatiellia bacterium]|jgi:heme-degrading monooxygenase HmoA